MIKNFQGETTLRIHIENSLDRNEMLSLCAEDRHTSKQCSNHSDRVAKEETRIRDKERRSAQSRPVREADTPLNKQDKREIYT